MALLALGHSAEIINGQARLCVSGAHAKRDAQSPFGDAVILFCGMTLFI